MEEFRFDFEQLALVPGCRELFDGFAEILPDEDGDFGIFDIYIEAMFEVEHVYENGVLTSRIIEKPPIWIDPNSSAYRAFKDAIQLQCTDQIREAIAERQPQRSWAEEHALSAAQYGIAAE